MFTHVRTCLVKILGMSLEILPTAALAWGGDDPTAKGLGWFVNIFLGQTGTYIAILAIIGTGLACLARVINWIYFVVVIAGISIIFGSGSIVSGIKSAVA